MNSEHVAADPLDTDRSEEYSLMFMKYVYYPVGRALRSAKSFIMVVYENIFGHALDGNIRLNFYENFLIDNHYKIFGDQSEVSALPA